MLLLCCLSECLLILWKKELCRANEHSFCPALVFHLRLIGLLLLFHLGKKWSEEKSFQYWVTLSLVGRLIWFLFLFDCFIVSFVILWSFDHLFMRWRSLVTRLGPFNWGPKVAQKSSGKKLVFKPHLSICIQMFWHWGPLSPWTQHMPKKHRISRRHLQKSARMEVVVYGSWCLWQNLQLFPQGGFFFLFSSLVFQIVSFCRAYALALGSFLVTKLPALKRKKLSRVQMRLLRPPPSPSHFC